MLFASGSLCDREWTNPLESNLMLQSARLMILAMNLAIGVPFAVSAQQPAASSLASSRPSDVRFDPLPHTNTVFTPARYDDLARWQARGDWLRDQVRLAAGLIPEPTRVPLDATIFGKLPRDGYSIEKVYFRSAPGVYVTGNLYRPAAAKGRCPAVACPHGHWPNGRLHHDDVGSIPARCITLARAGAVVFAYDMVGYNDSARAFKHADQHIDTPETALWGIGHLPLQTLNSIRVIDFLQSLPDVDPARIGVTGASGGGTQTFILGAIDDRIAVDCPVNMISSTMQGGCICENAPLLRIGTNNMEIAALFAPRPRLMVSASGDWTKLTQTVEFPFVRSIYDLYGATDRIANVHVDSPHNYNLQSRQAMYRFFGQWLLNIPNPDQIKEANIPVEKPQDMLVFDDSNVPADLTGAERLVQLTKEGIREQMAGFRPTSASKLDALTRMVRLWLTHAAGDAVRPSGEIRQVDARTADRSDQGMTSSATYTRNGRVVTTTSYLGKSTGPACIIFIVDPDGNSAVDKHRKLVDTLVGLGHNVTFVEPFGTGNNRRQAGSTQPADQHKFFTTFNATDDAETVHDILTVIDPTTFDDAFMRQHGVSYRVRLVGFGRMGPLCLLARAMVPERLSRACNLRLLADLNSQDWSTDATYVDQLFIPQIQRFGGLPAIAAVAAGGPMWLHNTADKFDATWMDAARRLTNADVRITPQPAALDEMVDWLTSSN